MLFDIKLQANFWNESPCILIKVNNKLIVEIKNFIDNQERNIKFDAETNDKNQLIVKRINKSAKDTVVKNSKVIKDSLITITDIKIDKVSIKPLLHKGQFFPKYPEPWLSQQKELGTVPPTMYEYCTTLHHNGEWKLDFGSPIHVWFFQNISVEI